MNNNNDNTRGHLVKGGIKPIFSSGSIGVLMPSLLSLLLSLSFGLVYSNAYLLSTPLSYSAFARGGSTIVAPVKDDTYVAPPSYSALARGGSNDHVAAAYPTHAYGSLSHGSTTKKIPSYNWHETKVLPGIVEEEVVTAKPNNDVVATHPENVSPNGPGSFTRGYKNWQKGKVIGIGSYGIVHEGYDEDGHFFAAKEVSLHAKGRKEKQERINQLQQEIFILSKLSHENIVRYLGAYRGDDKLYVFLELVTRGSLAEVYEKYNLQDAQVSAYTRQILSGLNYLHKQNVIHRDVKCANILVDEHGSVKLADFGMAANTTLNGLNSCKGSVYWMAPEVVNSPTDTGYGLAADIWSLGCTVLEMLTRKVPYSPLEWIPAVLKISRGELPEIPNTLSAEARDFILACLKINPNERPTAAQLLNHRFLKIPTSMNSTIASPYKNATHW